MMRKSVYRKVIFIMLCVALLLLIAIAWKVQVFQILMAVPFFPVIKSVLNNHCRVPDLQMASVV